MDTNLQFTATFITFFQKGIFNLNFVNVFIIFIAVNPGRHFMVNGKVFYAMFFM